LSREATRDGFPVIELRPERAARLHVDDLSFKFDGDRAGNPSYHSVQLAKVQLRMTRELVFAHLRFFPLLFG
jgi:hypothetical protein